MGDGPLLSVAQVAARLQKSEKFVRAEIRRKRLRAIDLGKDYRISLADLREYEKERQTMDQGEPIEI